MEESSFRITRSCAKALGTSEGLMQKPTGPELKKTPRAGSKRKTLDENNPMCSETDYCSRNKRRAALSDVSNLFRDRSLVACSSAVRIQAKKQQLNGCSTRKNLKEAEPASAQLQKGVNAKGKGIEKITGVYRDSILPRKARMANDISNQYEKSHKQTVTSIDPEIVAIDLDKKDPQMCTVYALEIHNNMRVSELNCRPSVDYMDKVQQDITQSMRTILIDWIVEVSEEYKFVPDTLYLTVSLIDRFLSGNYVEKQRLQLLGITCMLIASKYEEISAPRVEEFCLMTDNTYSKEEVVKMESEVLHFLRFRLSVPTIKTFLRRFIQAAQATSENPSADVEYLANYLAELTLFEYSFLKHLPSLIAASAVFLARWTLDHSIHPWNPTLEHYTAYKIMDLKAAVVAIEELQSNAKDFTANAIREKYRQQRFNSVANLLPSRSVGALFSS